ncbi:MAG: tetratricopeptide repeat protein [Acidimicrobiia bacterium]
MVRLNRAVAVAEVDGPEAALHLVDGIEGLEQFHRYHVVRAELLRRVDRTDEARVAYRAALTLEPSEPEARHLARRLAELE